MDFKKNGVAMGNIIAHQFIGGKMGKQQNKTVPSGRPASQKYFFVLHNQRPVQNNIQLAICDIRFTKSKI